MFHGIYHVLMSQIIQAVAGEHLHLKYNLKSAMQADCRSYQPNTVPNVRKQREFF